MHLVWPRFKECSGDSARCLCKVGLLSSRRRYHDGDDDGDDDDTNWTSASFKVHVQSLLHILVSTWLNLKKTPFSVHSCTTSFFVSLFSLIQCEKSVEFPIFLGLVCVLLMIYYVILGHLWKCVWFVILAGVVNLTVFHLTNRRVSKALFAFLFVCIYLLCVSVSRGDIKALGCRVRGRRILFWNVQPHNLTGYVLRLPVWGKFQVSAGCFCDYIVVNINLKNLIDSFFMVLIGLKVVNLCKRSAPKCEMDHCCSVLMCPWLWWPLCVNLENLTSPGIMKTDWWARQAGTDPVCSHVSIMN